jgi:SAM-dependent methyltransferase
MVDDIPAASFDAAWCRWVACFVSSPASLVQGIARALRSHGVVVFHEYGDYASWRLVENPTSALPTLLQQRGFEVQTIRPLVFTVGPGDLVWQWPPTFLRSGAERLRALGQLSGADIEAIVMEFAEAERDPSAVMMTPLVLEIIAVRCSFADRKEEDQ